MILPRITEQGFTILEVVMALVLVATLAVIMVASVGTTDDAVRYEQTRSKMEAIRVAIFGNDFSTDNEGKRSHFGYLGDTGSLPGSLLDLVTKPGAMQTWVFSTLHGFGSGWRGPYLAATVISGAKAYDIDAWGSAFTYTPAGSPPTLVSQGSDKAAGGTGYATDLTMQFPAAMRVATVKGILEDFNARRASYDVTIGYPSGASAAITTTTSTTDANGYFTFTNIPFGVRSLRVTSPVSQQARKLVVDRSDLTVPSSLINLFGVGEAVSYVASSVFKNAANTTVSFSVASTYTSGLQMDTIRVQFVTGTGAQFNGCVVNGVPQTFTAVASNTEVDLSAAMILPPRSAANSIELRFSNTITALSAMTVTFEWVNRTRTDSVSFTVP